MSSIKFLDNVLQGKNTKSSYFLTIVGTVIGGSVASILFIVLFMLVYVFSSGNFMFQSQIDMLELNPFLTLIFVGLTYGIYALLFYLCIRFIHKKSFMSLINIGKNLNWMRIIKGAALWTGIMTAVTLVSLIFQGGEVIFNFNLSSFLILVVLSVLVFPLQASFEEIFFRGYLMQGFSLISKKPVVPLVLTALIFGCIHFYNGSSLIISISIVISAMILGLMLGIIVLGENGLETAMGVHIANNMFVAVILNSSDSGLGNLPSLITAQNTDPYSGIPLLILMAVTLLLIIFWNDKNAFSRIFRS